jgi:hypothetical protein
LVEQRRNLWPVAKVKGGGDERTQFGGRQFSERQQIHARSLAKIRAGKMIFNS